ncbi:MAG: hypothetical protein PHV85_09115 [Desulfovibrionaceae bacterium]|nr:hypothetical protein [Desulfovibrionaceae bacterium]MDD4952695.1 hypothetical protein [Desulfovibrionaceae bacterium]
MTGLRGCLEHFFNPLHVFCRLRQFGLTTRAARRVSLAYERSLFRMFAR